MATASPKTWLTHVGAAIAGAALVALGMCCFRLPPTSPEPRTVLDPLKTAPADFPWTAQPEPAFPIPPYARFLQNVRIVIDPGHGGRADRENWKRGPTGLREEEVNLRVAQFLREFLVAAGASVRMTRDRDIYLDADDKVDLAKRAALANEFGADLLLSVHHNGSDQPGPNYTTLYYHEMSEVAAASRCAARFLLTGLNDALRLRDDVPCAVLSDRVLYPNGLAVLRETNGPAVLSEASFHSNPEEETRLRDPVYNRREAYGLFLGLARWAQAGLPRVHVVHPTSGPTQPASTLTLALDDGLRSRGGWGNESIKIPPDSVIVKVDGRPARFWLDAAKDELRVEIPADLTSEKLRLFVDFENALGQHVLHPELEVRRSAVAIGPAPATSASRPASSRQPARPPAPKKHRPVTRP